MKKHQKKNKELAEIESKIQDIEDQLAFIGSRDVEISKLQDASQQVQHRLENLSIEQKKLSVIYL